MRGLGAMIAIELFEEGDRSRPNARLTADIVARARDKGLILLSCGPYYNVLRILGAADHRKGADRAGAQDHRRLL